MIFKQETKKDFIWQTDWFMLKFLIARKMNI